MVHLQLLIDEDEARGEQDNMFIYFKKQKNVSIFLHKKIRNFFHCLGHLEM